MTTVVEKTVRTTAPCRHFPCDRAYPGKTHTVRADGMVQHRQNWLYEPDRLQVGMVSFEDVANECDPGDWQVYIQLDFLDPPALILLPDDDYSGDDIDLRLLHALTTAIVRKERANAERQTRR